ncbi:MAG: ATP-binding protein [Treponema sp.]|nr:ATP-binding protein [Treponema sp.]
MSNEMDTVESLQLQIKKLNRLISQQEKQIARAEMVTSTRDRVMDMLKAERLAQENYIKQAHDDISEKNEHIRVMFENAPVGLTLFDEHFKFIDCNEAVLKIYGVTKEFYSVFFGSAAHSPELQPDGSNSRDKSMEVIKRVMNGETIRIEWVHCMPDGNPLPVELTMTRMKQGDSYIGLGYIYDMREQIRLREEIETKNKKLQTILDMLPVGVRIMRIKDGALTYANEASLKVFNCKSFEDQVSGHNGFEFMPEMQPNGKKTADMVAEFFQNDTVDIEMQCLKLGGEPFFARIKSCTVDYQGELSSLASIEDVTAEKKQQQILQNIAEKEREASKSKSNFLANMSHEMRTPMNAIIGMTTIGKKANDIEQKNHALNKIGDASSHLLGVINDVLDMAKIEANKLELSPVEYHFERMLQNVLTVVNFRVDEKRQRLTLNIDKNVPRFLIGDEQRLAQIITNLLSNAVKFTPEGGEIRLEAFVIGENDENCELRIEITDSGIGISAEQKERLFLAFEQAETGTSRQYGGTGLGLAISKRIIELMGGNIWIESELGKGARFIFTVKVQRGSKSSDTNESSGITDNIENDNAISAGEFEGKKLLIAEDIEINREILIALLEDTKLAIDCAENGKEALEMVAAAPEKYDIVFMDVQMPVMNGHEATRRIRALPDRRCGTLPIIALTANVFKNDIDDCLAAGMNDHLGKPLDIDRVLEKLRMYLR